MYTAVLIEPRKHRAIKFCLTNLLENLSSDWNILIVHGTENKEYIENILLEFEESSSRISLKNLNKSNLSIAEYNILLTSNHFYDYIPSEIFLITQTDAMISPKNKSNINDFLEYDYVGAPWKHSVNEQIGGKVGNGGLSLRNKSKMLDVIKIRNTVDYAEDAYFSLSGLLNIPSFEKAQHFSSETVWNPSSFGLHKLWEYFPITPEIDEIFPGIVELMSLQSSEDI